MRAFGGRHRAGAQAWLGQAAKPPYTVVWHYDPGLEYDPSGGEFILTARVTDDRGASAQHSVNISISNEERR